MARSLNDSVPEMKAQIVAERAEFCLKFLYFWDVLTEAECDTAKKRLAKLVKKESQGKS